MARCRKFAVTLATLVACFSLLLASANAAAAADRVALVIGNGAYQNAITLTNPPHDARSMADLLRALNFQVIEGEDLDKTALDAKLREFAKAAETANVTFVFYAGHGMQVDGKNYLIPIDAKLADATALDFETVRVDRVINYAKRDNGIAIVLLDACRDNPLSRRFARSFKATRSAKVGKGLAPPDVSGGGIIVGFATAPGDEASDGNGDHSPFTAALLKELPASGVEIQQALTRVKADVYDATKGEQEPWHNSNLRFEFYLNPASVPSAKGGGAPALSPDEALWQKLEVSNDPAAIKLYIDAYPSSPHLPAAKMRLAALTKNEKFRTVFAGDLKVPSSPTYVAFHETTVTRDGPGNNYASRFNLKLNEKVRAIGAFSDGSGSKGSERDRTWIKVATADGNEGFALAHDLLTPAQFHRRKLLLSRGEQLKADLARAEKSWGPLAETAGIWNYGDACNPPQVYSNAHAAGFSDHDLVNMSRNELMRWRIWWNEGSSYYEVILLSPELVIRSLMKPKNRVSLRGVGRVQLYRFSRIPVPGRISGATELVGFKGDHAYRPHENVKTATRCGTIGQKETDVLKLWSQYVEMAQWDADPY